MVAELQKLMADRPAFWFFATVVVIIGGPAFVNQTAERIWPTQTQVDIAKDVEWSERRSNRILANQKSMLELLHALNNAVQAINSDIIGLDLRLARLEAWRTYQARIDRESEPGVYP